MQPDTHDTNPQVPRLEEIQDSIHDTGDSALPPRKFITIVLCLAVLICAAFSIVARSYSPTGHTAVPQADALIYQQYARAIAEGHPYRFMPGDPPSTGSTSHLYPILLAGFYVAGFQGDALATAGFLLNAFCYLALLALVWDIARRLAPKAAPLATLLVLTSGQTVFTFLGQSDMGVFTFLSFALWWAAFRKRFGLCALLLFLAPWTRPEGGVFVLLFPALCLFSYIPGSQKPDRTIPKSAYLLPTIAGIAGLASMLFLNFALTGIFGFHSLLPKNVLAIYPLYETIFATLKHLAEIGTNVVFGIATEGRQFYTIPIVGGLLGITGLLTRDWRRSPTAPVEIWWLGATTMSIVLSAMSDWQGVQHDRYMAWIIPTGLIYVAIGAHWVSNRLFRNAAINKILVYALVLYQILGLAYFASVYTRDCASRQPQFHFARTVADRLPAGSRIGVNAYSGLSYYLPGYPILNVNGITTPQLTHSGFLVCTLETLKHRKDLRFDYWLIPATDAELSWFDHIVGQQIMAGTPAADGGDILALHYTRWDPINYGPDPLTTAALTAVENMEMADRLDVGYLEDEERCSYQTYTRIPGIRLYPFSKMAPIAGATTLTGRNIADVGRVVYGYERFRIRCRPGQAIRMIWRTALKADPFIFTPGKGIHPQTVRFIPPLGIPLFVNGQPVQEYSLSLPPDTQDFHEVVVDLPASAIITDNVEITVGGDHMAFGYWFYQERRSDSAKSPAQ